MTPSSLDSPSFRHLGTQARSGRLNQLFIQPVRQKPYRERPMITPQRSQLRWRVLVVDDELADPSTAGGRAVRGLVDELVARGVEVVEALSLDDGAATV